MPRALLVLPVFEDKAEAGLREYKRHWDGRIDIHIANEPLTEQAIRGFDLVAASADDHRQLDIALCCADLGVPCIYTIENTVHARRAMCSLEAPTPLHRWRRQHWITKTETRRRAALQAAVGIQANGIPAFEAYSHPNSLLYFDSRATSAMQISDAELEARLHRGEGPLRLIFSGRLTPIKGVTDLMAVAKELKLLGTNFTLDIFGDGPLFNRMQSQQLPMVRLHGSVDFESELMPFVKTCDVFVCCHPQGDPSCTYFETYSCGVPIVGYANEALSSHVARGAAGWTVGLGDTHGLAIAIDRLANKRDILAQGSRNALTFAQEHPFEQTFERRIRHWQTCLN